MNVTYFHKFKSLIDLIEYSYFQHDGLRDILVDDDSNSLIIY